MQQLQLLGELLPDRPVLHRGVGGLDQVEFLLDREGTVELGAGGGQGGGVLGDGLLAELQSAVVQVQLAAAHGLVDVEQAAADPVAQLLGALVGERPGPADRVGLRGGPAPTADQRVAATPDGAGGQHPAGDPPTGAVRAQLVGEGLHATDPVVVADLLLDRGADPLELRVVHQLRGRRDGVGPVLHRHGQQHVVGTEVGQPRRLVGPGVGRHAAEGVHERDEDLDALVVAQPVDRLLDGRPVGVRQHPGVVGDPVGQAARLLGRGRPGEQQRGGREPDGEQEPEEQAGQHGAGSWHAAILVHGCGQASSPEVCMTENAAPCGSVTTA